MAFTYTVASRYLSRRSILRFLSNRFPAPFDFRLKEIDHDEYVFETPRPLTPGYYQEMKIFAEEEDAHERPNRSVASQLQALVRPNGSHTTRQQPAISKAPLDENFTEVRGRRSVPDAEKHLLDEFREQLSIDNWNEVRNQLPVHLRDMVEYGEHNSGTAYWTCTPDEAMTPDLAVPLTIAGAPVIIPIDYQIPFRAPLQPPPDPRPDCLDPTTFIAEDVVEDLFDCFADILGFYLLINGLLQIIVPADFDYDWAYDQQPARFGGLRGKERTSIPLVLGDSVMVKDRVQPMKAKIGVATRDSTGDTYITIPTHLISKALKYSKTPINQENIKKVNVYHARDETTILGTVEQCFDRTPDSHPFSFEHDLSLVKLKDTHLAAYFKAPSGIRWLPFEEIGNLKLHQTVLSFLQPQPKTVITSIPLNSTQLITVGQGVLRRQPSHWFMPSFLRKSTDQFQYIENWKTSIFRSILYRAYPDLPEDGLGESGTAICVQDPEDATLRILGFQSFSHKSNRPQKERLEGNELYKDLGQGIVAFYGAFLVPEALKEHQIL